MNNEDPNNQFEELLKKFDQLPKKVRYKTFMEICKYPGSRFEEVCSRILAFYFNPKENHQLGTLLFDSLMACIEVKNFVLNKDNINVILEDVTDEGKRIDIVLEGDDFVIGIENKINAELYNPLDLYAKRLREYKKKHTYGIVLSNRTDLKIDEEKKIQSNDFKFISYETFLNQVKKLLEEYISNAKQEYISYLSDFIRTIEGMDELYNLDEETRDFFFDKKEKIDSLINTYNNYRRNILQIQKDAINPLRDGITKKTKVEWFLYQGWDLGYKFYDKKTKLFIGIESNYEATKDNPLGLFKIFITTWKVRDWLPFKEKVLSKYPNPILLDEANYQDDRVYLHLPPIEGNNQEKILEELEKHYNNLKEIFEEVKAEKEKS